ncbi:MAG TPA: SDR family oxidoreductase [Casimicrobiaceae bacterium]|nr:SDR family oxidoreductase [Casimicrobiaceae bacterium]
MQRLGGKVAFITGAGAGIGRAAAQLFAREGAAVALADVDATRGAQTQSLVRDAGGSALFLQCDVRDEASVAAAVADAVAQFGRLDILFNCAGGSIPADSWITDVDMAVWDRTMTLDLKGTMHCCRHAIPRMVEAGGGAVVNMSSGAALRGASPSHIYTAAKGAVVSLTRALAGAYAADNVRVNAICAGRINTERIRATYGIPGQPGAVEDRQRASEEVRRYPFWFGEPEDIANIALFLASDESRMITGAAIPADGGRSAY